MLIIDRMIDEHIKVIGEYYEGQGSQVTVNG